MEGLTSLVSPSAWEGISIVTFVVVMFVLHAFAFARGWLVFGPAHREIVSAKDDAIEHLQGRSLEDQRIISAQAGTIAEQKVSGELSAHIIQAIREATGNAGPR